MKLKHYLLSTEIIPDQLRLHAYLMCNDQRYLTDATNKIIDEAEKLAKELKILLFLAVLVTELSTGKKMVREIIEKHVPGAKENLRTAKDYHLSMWFWSTADHPDDTRLWELH